MARGSGTSGKSHCGQWTRDVPQHLFTTRLVCTLRPGHRGDHFSRWCDLTFPAAPSTKESTET